MEFEPWPTRVRGSPILRRPARESRPPARNGRLTTRVEAAGDLTDRCRAASGTRPPWLRTGPGAFSRDRDRRSPPDAACRAEHRESAGAHARKGQSISSATRGPRCRALTTNSLRVARRPVRGQTRSRRSAPSCAKNSRLIWWISCVVDDLQMHVASEGTGSREHGFHRGHHGGSLNRPPLLEVREFDAYRGGGQERGSEVRSVPASGRREPADRARIRVTAISPRH